MSGPIYFADEVVSIDPSHARFGGKIYTLEEIDAVDVRTHLLEYTYDDWRDVVVNNRILILGGGFVLLILRNIYESMVAPVDADWALFILQGIPWALLICVYIVLNSEAKRLRYVVRLKGTFGEQDVVIARNHRYAKKVRRAIRAALEARKSHLGYE